GADAQLRAIHPAGAMRFAEAIQLEADSDRHRARIRAHLALHEAAVDKLIVPCILHSQEVVRRDPGGLDSRHGSTSPISIGALRGKPGDARDKDGAASTC